MWFFGGRQKQRSNTTLTSTLIAARPHPSRLLRLPTKPRGQNAKESARRRYAEDDKMAIIIREDIRLSAGHIANFAASIGIRLFQKVCIGRNSCSSWNAKGQKKVILKIDGEESVQKVIQFAREKQVAVTGVRMRKDSQTDSVKDGETAPAFSWIAIGVFGPRGVVDGLTRGLKPL